MVSTSLFGIYISLIRIFFWYGPSFGMAVAWMSVTTQWYGYGPDMNKWLNMNTSLYKKLALVYDEHDVNIGLVLDECDLSYILNTRSGLLRVPFSTCASNPLLVAWLSRMHVLGLQSVCVCPSFSGLSVAANFYGNLSPDEDHVAGSSLSFKRCFSGLHMYRCWRLKFALCRSASK
jgi:hypothetical protein